MTKLPKKSALWWTPDHNNAESVDDLVGVNATSVRLERMSNGSYWLCVEAGGERHDFDFYSKRKIIVFPRQPSPKRPAWHVALFERAIARLKRKPRR